MATNGAALNVMAMPMDTDAHTDTTNMNTNNGGVGHARTQQGRGKNRGNQCFHRKSLSRAASPPPCRFGVDGRVAPMVSRASTYRSEPYNLRTVRLAEHNLKPGQIKLLHL